MKLINKNSIITGAASGFGAAIAKRFAVEGSKVACLDINLNGAKKIASQIGKNAIAVECDVSSANEIENAVQTTLAKFGSIDIVINNAGWTQKNEPALDVDFSTFKRIYEINVDSIFHMTKSIVPHWRERKCGVMINVGSTAGISPRPGLTWYNSSKGAVNLMTKALAIELAPESIRVCGLAPVMGATPLLERFMGLDDTPENREKFLPTIPMGRLCEPEDMAYAALCLASDEANFLTGVILPVDGGRTI
tara:strand:- start:138 stop:887 length:750 start_codon:yes stop_codon:yes gene_type:complete